MSTRFSILRLDATARRVCRAALVGGLLLGALLAMAPDVAAQSDSDGDGLYDQDELVVYGTDPSTYDSDWDGVGDGEEVYYGSNPAAAARPDSDGDGLFDDDELAVYGTNPSVFDTDGDGTSDGAEVYYGTDPLVGGGFTTTGTDYTNQCVGNLQFGNTGNFDNADTYETDGLEFAIDPANEVACESAVQQSSAASSGP